MFVLLFCNIVSAQNEQNSQSNQNDQGEQIKEEVIMFFSSNIKVKTDNSINVTEQIIYNTGDNYKHGIYRDIYPYSSQKRRMKISNISVFDENGTLYKFQVLKSGENIRIKIGDPNVTFNGQKTYVIDYRADMAIGQLKDFDEIYWNVTGNNWPMPIREALAVVIMPDNTKIIQSACYYGLKGEKTLCSMANYGAIFKSPRILNNNEGLTIALGFAKGVVSPYTKLDLFLSSLGEWIVSVLIILFAFILSFAYWYKRGRDDRGLNSIIPQYDVFDDMTPMEVSGIINESINIKNVSAEIIYLAINGYLKIKHGVDGSGDYEFIRLKNIDDIKNDFDREIFLGLFGEPSKKFGVIINKIIKNIKRGKFNLSGLDVSQLGSDPDTKLKESIKISDLKNKFYVTSSLSIREVTDALFKKGYYKNLGKMKGGQSKGMGIFASLFVSFLLSGFLGPVIGGLVLQNIFLILPIGVGIFFALNIISFFYYFSPAKTIKGVVAKEHLLGLKMYLQIAEKDRIEFHNAPAKTPEVFEKFLPYAMVLGVSDLWIKEFEDIHMSMPDWYVGDVNNQHVWSSVALGSAINDFSKNAGNTMFSSPRSSGSSGGGSGGGGFSGGGGGGGGGGSW